MVVGVLFGLILMILAMLYSYIDSTDLPGEMFEDVISRATRYGYLAAAHNVTTSDGYILTLFHLSPRFHTTPPSPPILFLHGIGVNSDQFAFNLHTKPIAFRLIDEGFDVWLGNARGSAYSEGHVHGLTPDEADYWEWTAQDIVDKDAKAMVDEVYKVTGKKTVIVGHSQGAMVGMAYLARFPKENYKVALLIAIACPSAKNSNESWIFKLFLHPVAHSFFSLIGKFHFFRRPQSLFLAKIMTRFPSIGYYYVRSRYDSELNGDLGDKGGLYSYRLAGGTSLKNLLYYAQNVGKNDPRPSLFDYGEHENLLRYNSPTPPIYNYTDISTPMAFFGGKYDMIVKATDIEALMEVLQPSKVVFKKLDYNHDHGSFALSRNQEHVKDVVRLVKEYGGR